MEIFHIEIKQLKEIFENNGYDNKFFGKYLRSFFRRVIGRCRTSILSSDRCSEYIYLISCGTYNFRIEWYIMLLHSKNVLQYRVPKNVSYIFLPY